jgi:hypothetical protein
MKLTTMYELAKCSPSYQPMTLDVVQEIKSEEKICFPDFFSGLIVRFKKRLPIATSVGLYIENIKLEYICIKKEGDCIYRMEHFKDCPYPYVTHPNIQISFSGEVPDTYFIEYKCIYLDAYVISMIHTHQPYYNIDHPYKIIQFGHRIIYEQIKKSSPRQIRQNKKMCLIGCAHWDDIIHHEKFQYLRYHIISPIFNSLSDLVYAKRVVNANEILGRYVMIKKKKSNQLICDLRDIYPQHIFEEFSTNGDKCNEMIDHEYFVIERITKFFRKYV